MPLFLKGFLRNAENARVLSGNEKKKQMIFKMALVDQEKHEKNKIKTAKPKRYIVVTTFPVTKPSLYRKLFHTDADPRPLTGMSV